jgi:hypothetical protein
VRPVDVGLCCRHQAHQLGESLLMSRAALLQGEGLIAVRLGAEKRTHLVEQAAEARSRGAMFESAHRPIPLFDASMILLQVVIQVAIRAMLYVIPENITNGAGVGIMAIGGDAVWDHTGHRPGGTEEDSVAIFI